MADALAELEADRENAHAWRLFRQVVNRFTFDAHAVALAFERLTRDESVESFTELLERFELLYSALYPPPERKTED